MDSILREITTNDWITIVMLLCVTLLAVAKYMNSVLFVDFIDLFTTNKYIVLTNKGNKLSSLFNVVLMTVQILSISLFMYICVDILKIKDTASGVVFFLKIAAFYALISIFKILIEKIVATIFSIEILIDNYLFYKVSYRNFLGILLLPFNLLFVYSIQPSKILLLVMLITLLVLNLIVLILVYKKNENVILNHLFYFILYLCTLEIAPYFILYKLII